MTTPVDLARTLGISPKTLRAWLRREHPRPPVEAGQRWRLTPEQVASARARFGPARVGRHAR